MPVVTRRCTAVIGTNGTTWATTTNAVDGSVGTNPATYATWTNSTSSATGFIELGTYGWDTVLGASDTVNSVTMVVRNLVNNTGRITSVQYQGYDGATALGTIRTGTLNTAAHDDSGTVSSITTAQLRSTTFKVRVNATHAANTQSLVLSVDHVDVTVDYTVVPPSLTQAAYRIYDDNGSESAATALAAQDTSFVTTNNYGSDCFFHLRVRLQSTTAVDVASTDDFQLQYDKNSAGSWTNVSTGSTGVRARNSANLTDAATTTSRLTGG